MQLIECYNTLIVDYIDGYNDEKQQWVAYSNWTYTLKFKLSSTDVKNKQLVLKCDGIDTVANIRYYTITAGIVPGLLFVV